MTAITNLPSLYEPFSTEAKWQTSWEENQIYKADPNHPGVPYCVVIPPPNVTGSLHMGHAFESALIDALVRYHRMKGRNTLWLPGTDHASIAVQTILEKQLKSEGKNRYELGRDKFLERAWQWKAESGGTIINQLRRLGVSVDWSRERFTLDEGLSKAVLEAFIKLYEEGLIYRSNYLVNWCPASQSAVSDLEVEPKEVNGSLWHFRYYLTDGTGYVEVATTRPETMLGDTAVAVNPEDSRYKDLIGKTLNLPIMNRQIPIIADELVDPAFGTGCVKVTPAHDPNDFEMGKRHNLPFINIMNKDGTLNDNAGEFQGQDRFVARKNVVSRLEAENLLIKVEEYKHTVPYSDRGKVPVEPLLSTQWFVKIRPLADKTLEFLDQENSPEFVPQRWGKVYRDWLVNLRDWCISRQLWWGHQIPAWYAVSETGGEITDSTPYFVAHNETEALEKARSQWGENVQLIQDPDVLDTWFSSGLWPFSTLGWPEKTPDFDAYYPTTTLVTGFDIIFFWVARMTMMAGHFTGKMPFQTVYIHGLVRDENNKKMSKSANNGIDPLLLIDKYGTDALRYTLVKEVVGAGQDIRLEYDRKKDESVSVEASRNFANKLWNAARFVMMNLDGQTPEQLGEPQGIELSDRWILSRYHQVVEQTNNYIDNYGLGEAAKGLYEFIWGDFCDWYIELVKSRLQNNADPVSRKTAQQILASILSGVLKLLHPFMPHITEEIWQTLTQQSIDNQHFLALQSYPEADDKLINSELEDQFDLLIATIRNIRNLRAEADVKPGAKITANLESDSEKERAILVVGQDYIKELAKVETLTINIPQETREFGEEPEVNAKTNVGNNLENILKNGETLSGPYWDNFRDLAIILGVLVILKVAFFVGNTLLRVPLFGSLFEAVGLFYVVWFVLRHFVTWKSRQEFLAKYFPAPAKAPETEFTKSTEPRVSVKENSIAGVVGTVQIVIPLTGVVDVEVLRAKLEKSLGKVQAEIDALTGRLNNANFVDKAPPTVVQTARDALAEAEKQAQILRERLADL
ncbi:valine--tRNA ligase [Cylindrospermopsis raciborskii]|uniref:valine--tRNA ligase n=1 Tax=Cylindrospermopsis raciborskii TaxID=77022 RepID=UPI000778B9B8|nr:valine--tRNA ligase [Cylindrospermopsis raciborskii]MCZ2202443.1 valine--tRNA ligase [Cylindrospermopsis raciborskii PAMP2012]MCZ2206981.1 valine--tRNA ligase [Cylindrospermopsis raciborskii PAMP2011]